MILPAKEYRSRMSRFKTLAEYKAFKKKCKIAQLKSQRQQKKLLPSR